MRFLIKNNIVRKFTNVLLIAIVTVFACGSISATAAPQLNARIMEDNVTGEIPNSEKEGWELTFEDTFEGDSLDEEKWSHSPEWKRKDGYWSDDEAFLDGDGNLIIQVSEHDGTYYSGAVTTRDKFEQAYGYYEMRAKLPKEEGFWSAFWLMTDGAHDVGDDGRDGTEIDIVETPFAYRNNDTIGQALHWNGYEEDHQSAGNNAHIPGIYEGFHTFAVEWNKDEYIFYVDGNETWRTDAGGISQVPAFVQITAEVGEWGGNVENANLPDQLVVDYVRVYEQIPSSAAMKKLIERLDQKGEFANHGASHSLLVHLSAVAHFEKRSKAEKVVKHMNGFMQLLDHQQENKLISEKAYNMLKSEADSLIEKWQ